MSLARHIVLIGNYPPDRQESMERFTRMVEAGFRHHGVSTEIWRPVVFFGAWSASTTRGLGKWLGYLDKWVLFPLVLRWRQRRRRVGNPSVSYHICDHSNAPYLGSLPADQTVITCHDVLAIRGALGYADAYCPASRAGKILQKWILSHLKRARRVAAVSTFTYSQLLDLCGGQTPPSAVWKVIYNAFNDSFYPLPPEEAAAGLARAGLDPDRPFVLHVGSNLPRKNRSLFPAMIAALGERWRGVVYLAGQSPDADLWAQADALGVRDRIIAVPKPDHSLLLALYSTCEAFVFPSFAEGFGWPVIEAQACGAPVLASCREPMPEVGGPGAHYADPADAGAFAEAFLSLRANRAAWVARGNENIRRFTPERMMSEYMNLHGIVNQVDTLYAV